MRRSLRPSAPGRDRRQPGMGAPERIDRPEPQRLARVAVALLAVAGAGQRPAERVRRSRAGRRRIPAPRQLDRPPWVAVVGLEQRELDVGVDARRTRAAAAPRRPARRSRARPRPAASSASPSAITYSGNGRRSTERPHRRLSARRGRSSRASPAVAPGWPRHVAPVRAPNARRAAAPRGRGGAPARRATRCTYALFSAAGPPASTASRIASTAPSRSPCSSRRYDARA